MRHKKRTKYLANNLSHNTHHNLLHSDKSINAYFYNIKHECSKLSNNRVLFHKPSTRQQKMSSL